MGLLDTRRAIECVEWFSECFLSEKEEQCEVRRLSVDAFKARHNSVVTCLRTDFSTAH